MNERYRFDVEFSHATLSKEYKAIHNPTTKLVIEFGGNDFYSLGFNRYVMDQVAVKFKEEYSALDNINNTVLDDDFNWNKMEELVDGMNWSIVDGKIRISILLDSDFTHVNNFK